MVYFPTKVPHLSKFWGALEWKRLVEWKKVGILYGHLDYITAVWYILWPFGN
jgi:hypothetical protein